MLVSRIDMQTEVETSLPEKYAVSPAMAQAVKAIPGIVEVREV